MSTKRKHQDIESAGAVHESRQFQVPGSTHKPAKKSRKSKPGVYDYQGQTSSVNAIKKQLRDTTRKLERSVDISADVRMDGERAVAAYKQDLAAAEAEKIRQKMIKRYHMVRFFERQKATRHLKKLRKQLLETKSLGDIERLKNQMHAAEVDLNYTQYYPLSEAYISIYHQRASGSEEHVREADEQAKPPMWFQVEKCMEEGTLDNLRNRVTRPLEIRGPRATKYVQHAKPKMQVDAGDVIGLNRRERRSQTPNTVRNKHTRMVFEKSDGVGALQAAKRDEMSGAGKQEDSDGGFFEDEE